MAFAEDVGSITTAGGAVYHAGSTALVAADMLRLMQKEAPLMVALTFVIVVMLKFLTLRSMRLALLSVLVLLAGFLGLFGLMVLFGVKLNFYNLVVLPAVLGIGDDAGLHLVHRYAKEGAGSVLRVLRSTGEHITMSALTTMVGFAGLLRSFYPGMRSIGVLAVLGIGMTLVAALVGLPALLQVLERHTPGGPASARQGDPACGSASPTLHRKPSGDGSTPLCYGNQRRANVSPARSITAVRAPSAFIDPFLNTRGYYDG
jgi:predicted RND superfamily exporter protein